MFKRHIQDTLLEILLEEDKRAGFDFRVSYVFKANAGHTVNENFDYLSKNQK